MIPYSNPAIAVALGVAVLGEHVTPVMLAAFVTILAGSVLATLPGVPRRRPGAAAPADERVGEAARG